MNGQFEMPQCKHSLPVASAITVAAVPRCIFCEVDELRAERDALRGALEQSAVAMRGLVAFVDSGGGGWNPAPIKSAIAEADRALAPQPEPPKPAGADAASGGGERRVFEGILVDLYWSFQEPTPRLPRTWLYDIEGKRARVTVEVLPDEPVKGGG